MFIKGAPDVLLPRCDKTLLKDGTVGPLSDFERQQIDNVKDRWSSQGKRVILVAQKNVTPDLAATLNSANIEKPVMSFARDELVFVGLWALIDPLVSLTVKFEGEFHTIAKQYQ